MSNITAARQAIEAELAHVKQGIEFYTSRAAALEEALQKLDSVDGLSQPTSQRPTATRTKAAGAKRGRKPNSAKTAGELPTTGSEYWLQFLSDEPKSGVEIANAAMAALGFTPNADQKKKLKQRVFPALQTLLQAKKIKDTGSRRDRRFFLASGKSSQAQSVQGKVPIVNVESASLH